MALQSEHFPYLLIRNVWRIRWREIRRLLASLLSNMAAANADITLRELILATSTEADCRQWLRGRGLLAQHMTCPRCATPMDERLYARVSDGVIWRCPPKNCRATVSVRSGSFFNMAHLPLTKLTDLLYFWCMEVGNAQVEHQVNHYFAECSCQFSFLAIKLYSDSSIVSGLMPFACFLICSSVSITRRSLTGTASLVTCARPTSLSEKFYSKL